MKSLPARDPNREALAAAIALEAGARRALQVAKEAARYAELNCCRANDALAELRKSSAPRGGLAAKLAASIASGEACDVGVLELPRNEGRARIAATENEIITWGEAISECQSAVCEKEAEVSEARERLTRAARGLIAGPDVVARLMDGVEEMTTQVINRRVALRYILFNGLDGELAASDREKIEELFRTDRLPAGFNSAYNSGWEQHPVHKKWGAALDALMTDAEAALPAEIAGAA